MAVLEGFAGHGLAASFLASGVLSRAAVLLLTIALAAVVIDYVRILILHKQMVCLVRSMTPLG